MKTDKELYSEFWYEKETPGFSNWFSSTYDTQNFKDQNDYWIKRGYALGGWLAGQKYSKNNYTRGFDDAISEIEAAINNTKQR